MEEGWNPSVQLRFVIREEMVGGFMKRSQHLQQLWTNTRAGMREWRDVPLVEDSK